MNFPWALRIRKQGGTGGGDVHPSTLHHKPSADQVTVVTRQKVTLGAEKEMQEWCRRIKHCSYSVAAEKNPTQF